MCFAKYSYYREKFDDDHTSGLKGVKKQFAFKNNVMSNAMLSMLKTYTVGK